MPTKDPDIIFVYESLKESVLSDLFTFACLIFTFWANYKFAGGALFLQAFIIFIVFVISFKRASGLTKRMNPTEAYRFLKERFEDHEK